MKVSTWNILSEWIIRIVLAVVYYLCEQKITPFHRFIPKHAWDRILYEHKPDTVPVWLVGLLGGVVPILCLTLIHLLHRKWLTKRNLSPLSCNNNNSNSKSNSICTIKSLTRHNFHSADILDAILSYSLAVLLNGVITSSLKILVGRPRPDFFNRCWPNIDIHNADAVDGQLSSACSNLNNLNCDGDAVKIEEGRKSFPSGHSSTSFAVFYFLSLYLWGKTGAFGKRGHFRSWRFVSGLPFLFTAMYIVVSRTQDYRHHWEDVVVGSIIGIFSSHICYRIYYPKLASDLANLSYRQMRWCYDCSFEELSGARSDESIFRRWRGKRRAIAKATIPYDLETSFSEARNNEISAPRKVNRVSTITSQSKINASLDATPVV